MQIEVNTRELIDKLAGALIENKAKNDEIWNLYVKKQQEYTSYLKKFKTKPTKLKQEPYLSYQSTTDLEAALGGLQVHTNDTVSLQDKEYYNLINNISNLRAGHVRALSALASVSY